MMALRRWMLLSMMMIGAAIGAHCSEDVGTDEDLLPREIAAFLGGHSQSLREDDSQGQVYQLNHEEGMGSPKRFPIITVTIFAGVAMGAFGFIVFQKKRRR